MKYIIIIITSWVARHCPDLQNSPAPLSPQPPLPSPRPPRPSPSPRPQPTVPPGVPHNVYSSTTCPGSSSTYLPSFNSVSWKLCECIETDRDNPLYRYWLAHAMAHGLILCDGFFFSAKIHPLCTTNFNQTFTKPSTPGTLLLVTLEFSETVNIRILSSQNVHYLHVGAARRVEKHPKNDIGVQSFCHNFKTNQDIENRSLISPIKSEDKCSWTYFTLTFIGWRFSATFNIFEKWTFITV